jgi:hypothetical protein
MPETPSGGSEPRYKRSRDGRTIHHADCKRAKQAVPWFYPETFGIRDDNHLREDMEARAPWNALCKVCFR